MIEISKETIVKKIAALSAAEHYYSRIPDGAPAGEAHRAPLFTEKRAPLVEHLLEEACRSLAARLSGWAVQAEYGDGYFILELRYPYSKREEKIRPVLTDIIALDVWSRISAELAPAASGRAASRKEVLEDRLIISLL